MGNDKRVNPGVPAGGQFAAQNRPEGGDLNSPQIGDFSGIDPGEVYTYSHANGDFDGAETVFENIEVYRSEEDAEPGSTLWAEASVVTDFGHLKLGYDILDARAHDIDAWIRENYGDLRIGGSLENADWANVELSADIDFVDDEFPTTIEGVIEGGKARTGFATLDLAPGSLFWTGLNARLKASS